MSGGRGDVRSHAATLRRRARWLMVAALVGFLAGVGYVVVAPTPLTSTSLVLLPTPALAESSSSDVATQVRIATSANVLQRAGDALQPGLTVRQVERMVDVSAATNQLLQIEATAADGARAQQLAQAVAESYVNYVRDTAREVTAAVLGDLNNRRDDLQGQVEQLQREIAATTTRQRAVDPDTSEGRAEARLLAGLRTQQADLALQLDKVQDKIAAGTPVGSSATGTSVVQQATVATGPSLLTRLLLTAPAAALAALLLAGLLVLLTARRDPRIRSRDEIADAVSSPVLASLRARPQPSVAAWSTLLTSYQPTPVESWALRQLLRGLAPGRGQARLPGKVDHPTAVTVVSLAGDQKGVAIGAQLAAFAASLGITTRLAFANGQDSAPTLWACASDSSAPPRPNLHVGHLPFGERVDLTVFLVVVDRARPDLRGNPSSVVTVLSVAAGTATEQELARVAVAVDDAGWRLDGVVVADPDQADRTSGRHTIAERSQWPALPTRLTGAPPTTGPSEQRRGRP